MYPFLLDTFWLCAPLLYSDLVKSLRQFTFMIANMTVPLNKNIDPVKQPEEKEADGHQILPVISV